MNARLRVVALTVVCSLGCLWPALVPAMVVELPPVALADVAADIRVTGLVAGTNVRVDAGGRSYEARAGDDGTAHVAGIVFAGTGRQPLDVSADGMHSSETLRVLPGWVSLLPAFCAIAVALLMRAVVPALLLGLWLGATALQSFTPQGALLGMLDIFQVFIVNVIADADHAAIIVFTMLIGGLVGIITRNGGMMSIVRLVVSRARSALGAQVAVWAMGIVIFFDDYANTLVVGNTARPITDRLKVSREKLAYIVDSTAAPVTSIALITTWIGYEVGLIDEALQQIGDLAGTTAYSVFLHSIPYAFYPLLAVLFVLMVGVTGRDFGPMYTAEVRARAGAASGADHAAAEAANGDRLEVKEDVPLRAVNAVVPIVAMVATLLGGLFVTGEGETLRDIIGSADPYRAMVWASSISVLTAAVMTIGQRILSVEETVDAWYSGARATLFGMIILVLAWTMSDVTTALDAKGYLVSILGESLPAAWLPAAVFVLAGVTSFATGTSWGTMGILVPLVVPLAWAVMSANGMTATGDMHILYSAVACVLAGAVWGDHCSPISDTTVLSSIASGCNHIEHVRTQMPYALLVGAVALLAGTVPGGYGVPPWVLLLVSALILYAALRLRGRQPDATASG